MNDLRIKYYDEEIDIFNEVAKVNEKTLTVTLDKIPSNRKMIIKHGYTTLTEVEGEPNVNEYQVDRSTGTILFNLAMAGENVIIDYSAIGKFCMSADKVFTNVDNKGNVIETLEGYLQKNKEIIDSVNTIGDGATVFNQLEAHIESAKSLTGNIIEGGTLNDKLVSTMNSARKADNDLQQGVETAQNKINEMNQWVDKHSDIVNLDTRVDNVELSIPKINEQLETNAYNEINARALNALGDNVKDNYIEFNNIFKEACKDYILDNSITSNAVITKSINIPCGVYVIKSSDIFKNAFTRRLTNLIVNGNGATIVFEGFEGDCFLNNDYLLNITFKDITFVSKNDGKIRNLLNSVSNGGSQGYTFEKCFFRGVWGKVIKLSGTDNNSEMLFENCGMLGEWESFLYGGDSSENGSNQFLNYWFNNCKYWSNSNWITMKLGGHICLNKCDVSGYNPTSDTYLFNLGVGTVGNTYGVQTFIDNGTRYELKSIHSKVIKCNWDLAQVSFNDSDFSSSVYLHDLHEDVFDFTMNGDKHLINFNSCKVFGKVSTSETSPCKSNMYFNKCLFYKTDDINVYFTRKTSMLTCRNIVLENCRLDDKPLILLNCILGDKKQALINYRNTNLSILNGGVINSSWEYNIFQPTLIKNTILNIDDVNDGYTYTLKLLSDICSIVSVDGLNITVSASDFAKIKIGQKLLINNNIYTVSSALKTSNRFTLTNENGNNPSVGETISVIVFDSGNIKHNSAQNIIQSNNPIVVYNRVYPLITSTGTNKNIYGKLILEILE